MENISFIAILVSAPIRTVTVSGAYRKAKWWIAQYILIAAMKNKSYEGIEYVEGLGAYSVRQDGFLWV